MTQLKSAKKASEVASRMPCVRDWLSGCASRLASSREAVVSVGPVVGNSERSRRVGDKSELEFSASRREPRAASAELVAVTDPSCSQGMAESETAARRICERDSKVSSLAGSGAASSSTRQALSAGGDAHWPNRAESNRTRGLFSDNAQGRDGSRLERARVDVRLDVRTFADADFTDADSFESTGAQVGQLARGERLDAAPAQAGQSRDRSAVSLSLSQADGPAPSRAGGSS